MSVGTLLTVKDSIITKREPIWPFPDRSAFPRANADGSLTFFIPQPYYRFSLGAAFDERRDS
jgi:hypothetical protein